ncbi:MAG: magnesium protoporphyrin IX methyltransferase [Gammaproteobacteria bacterium]|nr:magnesium protoporphyrin IX methyltransferase [Gammaproteobacteria bacterium]
MATLTYKQRRSEVEHYFDRTAAEAWSRLTSNAPVGRIRQTVRAGRDQMRNTLLGWLPDELAGRRILDAGCGTGTLAVEAARRGADVVAVDLSPTLIQLARERIPAGLGRGSLEFRVGDMWDPELGDFDHVIAMDSLIHYDLDDAVRMLAGLASIASRSMTFTFAPRTPVLAAMHAIGRWFPRSDRAPAIEPVVEARLWQSLGTASGLALWRRGRSRLVQSGFYTSQAFELERL